MQASTNQDQFQKCRERLRKIKPASTHYFGKGGDERIVDLIFQRPLKNGNGNLMAVIIFEHQSASLKKIPHKILKYISAIWDAEIKEGKKILSAPYFIVLRTAKKPHRGTYPTMTDSLPKSKNGQPVGKVVEVEYDVVDLPSWDFDKLIGGTVLRLVMGVLKKMIEGNEDEFPEALMPLREITDEEQQLELTRELLDFVAKALAAHNRRLDVLSVDSDADICRDKCLIDRLDDTTANAALPTGSPTGRCNDFADVGTIPAPSRNAWGSKGETC